MKCNIAECTNEASGKRIKIADFGHGKKWNVDVCKKHYNEAHMSRKIVESTEEEINRFNEIIEQQKETIRKRNLLIKQLRELKYAAEYISKKASEWGMKEEDLK